MALLGLFASDKMPSMHNLTVVAPSLQIVLAWKDCGSFSRHRSLNLFLLRWNILYSLSMYSGLLDFCNEQEIHEIADAMVSSGMRGASE